MRHYYVPKSKRDLVEYLRFYYPGTKDKLMKQEKKQLFAIYYNILKKYDRLSNSFMG